jgi:Zn-dependent peptidase ImmA (M78 family)
MSQHYPTGASALERQAVPSAEERVRRLARDKLAEADALLRQIGSDWLPPPFNPFMVAQALGIRCRQASAAIDDGMISVRDGDPMILYRRRRSKVQTYFTLFHEIAHTLFPEYRRDFLHDGSQRLFGPQGQLEYLCNIAAAEFLMPMDLFRCDLEQHGFGAPQVPYLCERYQAAAEEVCMRMIESDATECVLGLYEPRRQKRRRSQRQSLALSYALPSRSFRDQGLRLSSEVVLGQRNCIQQAARSRKAVCGEEEVHVGGGVQRYWVEALPLSERSRQNGQSPVLAFFYPD